MAGARALGSDLLVDKLRSGSGREVYRAVRRSASGERAVVQKRIAAPLSRGLSPVHLNLASLIDSCSIDGCDWLAAEWLEGADLAELVTAGGPLSPAAAAFVVAEAARGLAFLHHQTRHGATLVHGHLAPRKLRAGDAGEVKVTGLEHALASPRAPLDPETRAFASPERLAGEPLDPRSDVFSLGALLHFALTGLPPRAASAAASTVPAPLATLLHRALATDRALRPTAALVEEDLRHFIAETDPAFDRAALAALVQERHAMRIAAPGIDALDDGEPPDDDRRHRMLSPARAWALRATPPIAITAARPLPPAAASAATLTPEQSTVAASTIAAPGSPLSASPVKDRSRRAAGVRPSGIRWVIAGSAVAGALAFALLSVGSPAVATVSPAPLAAPISVVSVDATIDVAVHNRAVLSATSLAICATPREAAPVLPSDLREEVRRAGAESEVAALVKRILDGESLSPGVIASVDAARADGLVGIAPLSVLAHPGDAALRDALVREQSALHRFTVAPTDKVTALCERAAAVSALVHAAPGSATARALAGWPAAWSAAAPLGIPVEEDGLRYLFLSAERAGDAVEIQLRIDNRGADTHTPRLDRLRIESPFDARDPSIVGLDDTQPLAPGSFREARLRFALPVDAHAAPGLVLRLAGGHTAAVDLTIH